MRSPTTNVTPLADATEEVKERTAELTQSVRELRALGDVSQAVNSTSNIETVLSTIVEKAVQLSGAEAGTIYVLDEASQEFGSAPPMAWTRRRSPESRVRRSAKETQQS